MKIFNTELKKEVEKLKDEKEVIVEKIIQLEKLINSKTSDSEKEARQSSKKAAEYRNKTEDRLNQAIEFTNQIRDISTEIAQKKSEIEEKHSLSIEKSKELEEKSENILELLTKIDSTLEKYPDLSEKVDDLDLQIETIDENSSKSTTTYKDILSKKKEIEELHRGIIGYLEKGENGDSIKVDGLKDELEKTYDTLNHKIESLEQDYETKKVESEELIQKFIEENNKNLNEIKEKSNKEYDSIKSKIESLLPNALTAGLSSAFVKKKNEEVKLYEEYKKSFKRGIFNLTLVALMPIAISVFYILTENVTLQSAIERAPKIMLAFLPLYIPLAWNAISSNKKVNLSKRLIEEYSHKQVLSMTIEGLSKQIEKVENSDMSEELRIELLNNFLSVTNENPAKLILNYQKSDNPIFNLLDRDNRKKSNKSNLIDKASDKAEEIIEDVIDKATDVQ